jgi:hypothetical protein
MDLNLQGRHALVCGASEGIGRAAAHELAGLGASVTLLARREVVLQQVAADLPASQPGQRHGWIAVDANDEEALRRKIAAVATAQPIQILVNNGGGPPGGAAHLAASDDFLLAFRQHLLAAQACVQAVLPGMRATRWGRIVNVISTSVREPIPNLGVSNRQQRAAGLHPHPAPRSDPARARDRRRQERGRDRARDARHGSDRPLRRGWRDRGRDRVPGVARRRLRQRREPGDRRRTDAIDLIDPRRVLARAAAD